MLTLIFTLAVFASIGGLVFATGMTSLTAIVGKLMFMIAITLLLISVVVGLARGRLRV